MNAVRITTALEFFNADAVKEHLIRNEQTIENSCELIIFYREIGFENLKYIKQFRQSFTDMLVAI